MATIPSIAMIPSGVKASKLYSVLPTDGTGDFTTTRASVATRVNESGLIEEVAANVPRLDYSDGSCPSLLLEPAATNFITYSEDFSNVSWTKAGNTVVTLNNAISPDGTLNASTVTGLDGTSTNDLYTITTFNTSNKTVTYSVYLKGSGTLRINVSNNVDDSSSKTLTLTNNWEKYFITYSFNATITTQIVCNLDDLSATATTYEVWGAQLEENSYATSYIKNEGTALGVTRVADTATGSGNSTVINSTEGTLYAEISGFVNAEDYRVISLNSGGIQNRIFMGLRNDTGNVYFSLISGNVTQSGYISTVNSTNTNIKLAVKYKENDVAFWVNGIELYTDNLATMPIGLNQLTFDRFDGLNEFYGKTKSVQVYTTALSDAELTSLTTI